jgi:hypothetical protein
MIFVKAFDLVDDAENLDLNHTSQVNIFALQYFLERPQLTSTDTHQTASDHFLPPTLLGLHST